MWLIIPLSAVAASMTGVSSEIARVVSATAAISCVTSVNIVRITGRAATVLYSMFTSDTLVGPRNLRDRRTPDKNVLQDVPDFIIHRISSCVSYFRISDLMSLQFLEGHRKPEAH